MDWEFKISVMYDIAKVRQKLSALAVDQLLCNPQVRAIYGVMKSIMDDTEDKAGHVNHCPGHE